MAIAMHVTVVMGVMAQIEEAGMLTDELKAFFKNTLLRTDDDSSTTGEAKPQKVRKSKKAPGEKRVRTDKQVARHALVNTYAMYIRDDAFEGVVIYRNCFGAAQYMFKFIEDDPSMSFKEACELAVTKFNNSKGVMVFPMDDASFQSMKEALALKKPTKRAAKRDSEVSAVSDEVPERTVEPADEQIEEPIVPVDAKKQEKKPTKKQQEKKKEEEDKKKEEEEKMKKEEEEKKKEEEEEEEEEVVSDESEIEDSSDEE